MGIPMSQSTISYLWREPDAAKDFVTGVSLHSHTNQSRETLDFIAELSTDWKPIQPPTARHIPVSLEWTVPYGATSFHLGIHNLPSATGAEWMARFEAFTAAPAEDRSTASYAAQLTGMLSELHEIPAVLIIFNHPLWDLYRIGDDHHRVLVNDFLAINGQFIHALELNGLRNWKENREVSTLAASWNQLVISGGDRHGIEPNANINLTHATSFTEFVHEVRVDRQSHVLFMPQYAQPWKHRILQSTLDAIRNHPHFPAGSRRWDERVYHPDANGNITPLSELWPQGKPPRFVNAILGMVALMGAAPLSGGLRIYWNEAKEMRTSLAKLDA
jgi:hypothetical protein